MTEDPEQHHNRHHLKNPIQKVAKETQKQANKAMQALLRKSNPKSDPHRTSSTSITRSSTPQDESEHTSETFPVSVNKTEPVMMIPPKTAKPEPEQPTTPTTLSMKTILFAIALSVAIELTILHWETLMYRDNISVLLIILAYTVAAYMAGTIVQPAPKIVYMEKIIQQEEHTTREIDRQSVITEAKTSKRKRRPWTVLAKGVQLEAWQSRAKLEHRNEKILQRLRSNLRHNRLLQKKSTKTEITMSLSEEIAESDHSTASSEIGQFDLESTCADSLNDAVLAPCLMLRGMDVFLAEDPEDEVGSHPWLIEQGLRDVPCLVGNILTQWGNILVYFELPSWVKDWNAIQVKDNDSPQIKAIKNFLTETDEYRNERFKLVPSIVDGPRAVKMLAPPKRELLVHGANLPVTWKKYHAEQIDGRHCHPLIECQLDCLSARAMRAMASIVKNNLHALTIDLAIVIGQPKGKKEEEAHATLGIFRIDHIDVSSCPTFPDRYEKCEDRDVIRASQCIELCSEVLSELQELSFDDEIVKA